MHNGGMDNQNVRRAQLYELHRVALINVHYYAERIAVWTRINFWIQLVIAILSSAALAAMVKVNGLAQEYAVWAGGAASILAIYHSSANITAKIGQWERMHSAYKMLYHSAETLAKRTIGNQALTTEQVAVAEMLELQLAALGPQDDIAPNESVMSSAQKKVEAQLPDSYYYPDDVRQSPTAA